MKIIAGLGNPGQKYDKTKHNTGFMTMDHYLNEKGLSLDKDKFEGHWTKQSNRQTAPFQRYLPVPRCLRAGLCGRPEPQGPRE